MPSLHSALMTARACTRLYGFHRGSYRHWMPSANVRIHTALLVRRPGQIPFPCVLNWRPHSEHHSTPHKAAIERTRILRRDMGRGATAA